MIALLDNLPWLLSAIGGLAAAFFSLKAGRAEHRAEQAEKRAAEEQAAREAHERVDQAAGRDQHPSAVDRRLDDAGLL